MTPPLESSLFGATEPGSAQSLKRIELNITSDAANLRTVRIKIEEFAHSGGLPAEVGEAAGLVVNEALANVIRHGYHGAKDQPILVTAEIEDGEMRLAIRDWSRPFDPSKLPQTDHDLTKPENVKPGGLGLLCMRKLMDEAEFVPLPDGMLLKLVKRVKKA
jgi:anti-sigma regulatory factor (Ser/Thr protein kinase)